jgi:homoserine kinase type II
MAVYTDITDDELEAFLADFDLGRPLTFKGIAEGVENSNFLLETQTGRYFLTVYERRVRAQDLPFFLGLLQHLAAHGFKSATPIADRQGRIIKSVRGKPAALVSFLPGLSVRRPNIGHCREAGEGLAGLHIAGAGFTGSRENDLGHDSWTPMFARLTGAADGLKPGLAAQIQADLGHLSAAWPADLPRGIVHADYFPDNVFFADGKFAGAIDFYFACVDAFAYDIGVDLNAWCFEPDGSFNVTNARAFLEGYLRRRPLSDEERSALPIMAYGAAMRFFLTRLNDWGATPEGALVKKKDPLEYERKLAVHRAAVGEGLSLFGDGAA